LCLDDFIEISSWLVYENFLLKTPVIFRGDYDFMIVDLSIVSPFINAGYAGYEVDASRWPALASLISRVKEVPQVTSVLEKEARR